MDPLRSLGVFAASTVGLVLVFWPSWGLFWRWREVAVRSERVLIEDALKHLHACEYRGSSSSIESVAGILQLSPDRSAVLLARMESLGLVASHGADLKLTSEGRLQALQMIRIHRLWERYLAERSGLAAVDWHRQADRREHTLTSKEIDELEANLGYPTYDPHGDPIPTAAGEVPPRREYSLTDLLPGRAARIVHVEDEPEVVYAQIAAMGLYPGLVVRLIEQRVDRIVFWAQGREHILAPVSASNIAVIPIDEAIEDPVSESLADLAPGERARVVRLAEACLGMERQRLLDLGVVAGTEIDVLGESPLRDPVAYGIRGATIALRRVQAAMIRVERVDQIKAVA